MLYLVTGLFPKKSIEDTRNLKQKAMLVTSPYAAGLAISEVNTLWLTA